MGLFDNYDTMFEQPVLDLGQRFGRPSTQQPDDVLNPSVIDKIIGWNGQQSAQPQAQPPVPPAQSLEANPQPPQNYPMPMQGFGDQPPLPPVNAPMGTTAAGVPMPRGRPDALPPNAQPLSGGGFTTDGPPTPLAPPPSSGPVAGPAAAPGPLPSSGGPLSRLGINLTREQRAGLGAGLKSVGNNWNKPGLAAFAGSAGSAMEGESQEENKQDELGLKTQGQHFNQLSTAFKDKLAAEQSGNMERYRQAQAKYLEARATAVSANGGSGNNAMINTPFGRLLQVDKMVDQQRDRDLKVLQQQWKQNGTSEDDQKKQRDELEQKFNQVRQQTYQRYGIDPGKAQQIKDMGTSAKNPFGQEYGKSAELFHQSVPVGAWYLDQEGKLRKRTKPPPIPGKQSLNEANYDDQTAMAAG